MLKPVTLDFETFGIEQRPKYPPKPVGVSIKYPGKEAQYYAWGHTTGNNCDIQTAESKIIEAFKYAEAHGILCQNAKFDIDVAEMFFNVPILPWDKIHDTLYLLFLNDHRRVNLSLKPAAQELLGMPPDEQDEVANWLLTHQKELGLKIAPSQTGAYIAYAPGDIVGKYANGDTIRTEKLFELLYKDITDRGMLGAYNRERKLMRILLKTERDGLPIAAERLAADVGRYSAIKDEIANWLMQSLGGVPIEAVTSNPQLLKALISIDAVDVSRLARTPSGQYSTAKGSFDAAITDRTLLSMLTYFRQVKTCLDHMTRWLTNSKNGCTFTYWHQVRTPKSGKGTTVGARTGRLSSTPNFQNMPNKFKPLFAHELAGLPECPIKGLPPLPQCRSYIVPHAGHVLIGRDYSQQEPRIMAHFEDGPLLEAYTADPWLDMHDTAQEQLRNVGLDYARKQVKNTNLGIIYGEGIQLLADKNELTYNEASKLKQAILRLYPGLKKLQNGLAKRAARNQPFVTWGGRVCYCEEKAYNAKKRQIMSYEYKMLNVLIQGSAGDCTKEAVCRFDATKNANWNLLLTVHDEVIIDAPKAELVAANECLREAMESIEFDVSMLTEGDISFTNWAEMCAYDEKGVKVYEGL